MAVVGWQKLIPKSPPFQGEGKFRLDAYSEFLPAPWVGWKPYGDHPIDPELFSDNDPWGWRVNEFDEAFELRPGMVQIGKQVMNKLARLLDNDPVTGLPKLELMDNPFWPPELAAETKCPQEKCVVLLPLALSRSLDDKGRIRWTLFGNSEQGPGKAFWKSFFVSPTQEVPAEQGIAFFCRLLHTVYGEKLENADDLHCAGFRIMPDPAPLYEFWKEQLPSWTTPFLLDDQQSADHLKYLVTFRPFGSLPETVRAAYLKGHLALLPFPGSLTFWGVPMYRQLHNELPFALQLPLILNIARHRLQDGMRVPQTGFLHEPTAEQPQPRSHRGQVLNTFKRTHRSDKILRDQDELALIGREDKMLHVLFSSLPDDVSLYDKPMARNVQLWTEDRQLLLDGPRATPPHIKKAMATVTAGGLFGYRFIYPPMRVGMQEVYWHRPLIAYRNANNETVVLPDAPLGYLTAYDTRKPRLEQPIELWPRILSRPLPAAAAALPRTECKDKAVVPNVRKLFEAFQLGGGGKPLRRSFAQALLTLHRGETLDSWLSTLPEQIAHETTALIDPKPAPLPISKKLKVPESLTYRTSGQRSFEVAYWKTISALSEGSFLNRNNADCVQDEITKRMLPYHERQLENLGDYLLAYYEKKIAAAGMTGKALAGEVPFRWRTDFDFSWMGGWLKNQKTAAERDLLVMIPGRDRRRAVIMADHYDTAYMADRYFKENGGCGARLAACGADDNASATAAMMLAAPIFLKMSKQGLLDCDIWLVHLTGEEFPADCLGARALIQRLVEGSLQLHLPRGKTKDLSKTVVQGLYVSDMIAHNNDRERDIFQISPGTDAAALRLAYHAHMANETWNESTLVWNKDPERAGRMPGRRSPHGGAIPEVAPFLALTGQVRPVTDPRSTLYNTDGQVFSDAGVPCVLFMENYDINRTGYHDMHDTMENIDLDYGSALCAITIESVARAASSALT